MKLPTINPVHIKNKSATNNFSVSKPGTTSDYRFVTSPFRVLKFNNFITPKDGYFRKVLEDVHNLKFDRKANDLYSLLQTTDLSNVDGIESLSGFLTFLRGRVQPFLSQIFNVKLNGKIASTASLYEQGDYLLCHDDKCEDRCIAFVYYLTGESQQDVGGHFEMFEHNEEGEPTSVSISIPAEANSFLCFQVGDYSFHQVSEVVGKNFQRLSINGWFHSDSVGRSNNRSSNCGRSLQLQHQMSPEGLVLLGEYLNISYCTPSNILQMRAVFEKDSEMALPSFLRKKFFDDCLKALKLPTVLWKPTGPPNSRKYCVADESTLSEPVTHIVNMFKSSTFVSYFRNMSGLALEPYTDNSEDCSMFLVEVQKFTRGDYTMVTDTNPFFTTSGLDVFLFFNSSRRVSSRCGRRFNTGGCITYIAKGEDDELLTVEPEDNALQMVYRTSDTIRFMKYIDVQLKEPYYCISITYYEPFKDKS